MNEALMIMLGWVPWAAGGALMVLSLVVVWAAMKMGKDDDAVEAQPGQREKWCGEEVQQDDETDGSVSAG